MVTKTDDTDDKKGLHRLEEIEVREVSHVGRAANKRKYLVVKSDDDGTGEGTMGRSKAELERNTDGTFKSADDKPDDDDKKKPEAEAETETPADESDKGDDETPTEPDKGDDEAADESGDGDGDDETEVDAQDDAPAHKALLDEKGKGLSKAVAKLMSMVESAEDPRAIREQSWVVSDLAWAFAAAAKQYHSIAKSEEAPETEVSKAFGEAAEALRSGLAVLRKADKPADADDDKPEDDADKGDAEPAEKSDGTAKILDRLGEIERAVEKNAAAGRKAVGALTDRIDKIEKSAEPPASGSDESEDVDKSEGAGDDFVWKDDYGAPR